MEKPNCYKCEYRRTIPGDTHSMCGHPSVNIDNNPLGVLVDMLIGKTNVAAIELGIKGNAHGITHGWFMWPTNFDPIWLDSCNGFVEKGSG